MLRYLKIDDLVPVGFHCASVPSSSAPTSRLYRAIGCDKAIKGLRDDLRAADASAGLVLRDPRDVRDGGAGVIVSTGELSGRPEKFASL